MRDSDFLKRFGHIRKLLHRGLPPKSKVSATAFSNLGSTMLGLIQLVAQPDDLSDVDIWMSMSIIQLVAVTPYRRLQIALVWFFANCIFYGYDRAPKKIGNKRLFLTASQTFYTVLASSHALCLQLSITDPRHPLIRLLHELPRTNLYKALVFKVLHKMFHFPTRGYSTTRLLSSLTNSNLLEIEKPLLVRAW